MFMTFPIDVYAFREKHKIEVEKEKKKKKEKRNENKINNVVLFPTDLLKVGID